MTETMRSRRKINMTRKERKHEMLLTDKNWIKEIMMRKREIRGEL